MTSLRPHTEFMDKALKAALPGSRLHMELSRTSKVSETLGFVFKLIMLRNHTNSEGIGRTKGGKMNKVCQNLFVILYFHNLRN